jgi:hypothetical protein
VSWVGFSTTHAFIVLKAGSHVRGFRYPAHFATVTSGLAVVVVVLLPLLSKLLLWKFMVGSWSRFFWQ